MNAYVQRLFAHIPPGYDLSTYEVPGLSVTGTGTLVIEGDTLYATSGSNAVSIDLHGSSVESIVNHLPDGMSGQVLQNGISELLQFPEGQSIANVPVILTIPQNPIWFIVGMMARMLESRKRSRESQVAQLNLKSSTGRILDWWGASVGVERYEGEPDILYAQRISEFKFHPNVNNVAIEKVLATLGYSTSVTDTGPNQFSVQVELPTSPPQGFAYSTAQIQDAVNLLKAAGTIATIVLQGKLEDLMNISDNLSAVTNSSVWTWGNMVWGQFSW